MRGPWPVAVAVAVRLGLWSFIPASHLASDEDSYIRAGTQLLTTGQQDAFWPPGTGWLIAGVGWLFGAVDIRGIRLLWVAMDTACVAAVWILATRVGQAIYGQDDAGRRSRLAVVATLGYALYLPAISFSQFATSEMPALLLVLGSLVLLTASPLTTGRVASAGLLTGVLCITRPSLLPLVACLPGATAWHHTHRRVRIGALLFVAAALAVVLAVIARNRATIGEATIAQNSAYNLYIGNQDLYAEDLDLFHPVATPGQIEFRRQYFSGTLSYPTAPPAELQREALDWIRAHPATFVRRALGRLARVFAPKTDVLELLGGERAAGIFSPAAIALLSLANLQWVLVLSAGLVGLAALRRMHPPLGDLFAATVLGSLPLCLIAIAKPRYAFGFEPLLIIAAALVFLERDRIRAALRARDRWILAGCAAFLVWGWVAWIVFAVSSRVALASGS